MQVSTDENRAGQEGRSEQWGSCSMRCQGSLPKESTTAEKGKTEVSKWHRDPLEKDFRGSDGRCKGPAAGTGLALSRFLKKARAAAARRRDNQRQQG